MVNTKDILIFKMRVEEAYLLTIPNCKGLMTIKEVWLRAKRNPQLISNHSMYKDEFGTWWWYNDGQLIQLPPSLVVVEDFRYFYDLGSKPMDYLHRTGFSSEVEVLKTIYV